MLISTLGLILGNNFIKVMAENLIRDILIFTFILSLKILSNYFFFLFQQLFILIEYQRSLFFTSAEDFCIVTSPYSGRKGERGATCLIRGYEEREETKCLVSE